MLGLFGASKHKRDYAKMVERRKDLGRAEYEKLLREYPESEPYLDPVTGMLLAKGHPMWKPKGER